MEKNILSFLSPLLLLLFLNINLAYAIIPQIEREALISFYNATNGDNWNDNSGWKEPPLQDGFAMHGTENSWYGISLNVENSFVTEINYYDNLLTGIIPPELGNLSNLQELSFSSNQLMGSIPIEIGNLTNLTWFDLYSNQLTGSIPPEIGNLSNLQGLSFSSNQLTGSIPIEIGNLSKLEILWLDYNQLTGSIPPEIGNLSKLQVLWLDDNQLTGPVPEEMINLISLIDNQSDFCGNSLFTDRSIVRNFLNLKQIGGNWEGCQIFSCIADLEGNDNDVDGADISILANNPSLIDLGIFAAEFGTINCMQ